MDEHTVYAAIEQGETEWLARILEADKEPYYFVPGGIYSGIAMLFKSLLCKALNNAYMDVVIVSEDLFNRKVVEREAPDLLIEQNMTLP